MQDNKDLNVIDLLMGIKEDIASIKSDMTHFKESQEKERDNLTKEIADVRCDCQRQISDLDTKLTQQIASMQTVQNTMKSDLECLKHSDENKDAKRWRMTVRFILTALGGMLLAKIPDFVMFCMSIGGK